MPYRFTSEPNPADPMEKAKTPNISEKLLSDASAMKGLLVLAVEHAQELIATRGEYSQPETAEERLEKYNRSADPIVKFAGKAVETAGPEYKIRKDDAHRVYRLLAEIWEECVASERGFKQQFPGAFPEEIETARSRKLASEDDEKDRVRCWKRLKWTDTARKYMPDWMEQRYSDHFTSRSDDEDATTAEEPAIASFDPQYGAQFTATVQTVNEGEYSRKEQGRLRGPHGTYIGFVVPGGADITLVGYKGDTLAFGSVTLRTNDDGLLEAVIDDATEIATAGPSPTDDERPAPGIDTRADAQYLAELLEGRGSLSKTQIRNEAKEEYDMNLGRAGKVLEWSVEKTKLIEEIGEDEYRAL